MTILYSNLIYYSEPKNLINEQFRYVTINLSFIFGILLVFFCLLIILLNLFIKFILYVFYSICIIYNNFIYVYVYIIFKTIKNTNFV